MDEQRDTTGLDDEIARFVSDPQLRQDPFPFIARLRQVAPARWVPQLNSWFISSYEGINSLTHDSRWSVARSNWSADTDTSQWGIARRLQQTMILFRDDPDHARIRRIISPVLTPKASESWRDSYAAQVDATLDGLSGRDQVDLVQDFGYPLALWTLCRLLGLPDEAAPKILSWTNDYVQIFQPVTSPAAEERSNAVISEMRHYLEPLLEQRRRGNRTDDLMTLFAEAEASGQLQGDEAIAYTLMMSISAYDTSANLIALAVMYLLRHPAQWQQIVDDPSLIKNAVEEVMRYDNSVWNVMPRYALEDIELHGQTIRKGDRALSLLPGSGHDPVHFNSPETFDIHRANARIHLGFGSGGHVCSGQWLARIEVQEAVRGIAMRYPRASIAESEITWRPTFGGRNLTSLNVRLKGNPSVVASAAN